MPAVHRKPSEGGLLGSLNARAAAGSRGVDNFASIQTYYRRASLLLRQAEVYRRRHNDDELYVMLMRFATLVIETLPKHRLFNAADPNYKQLKVDLVQQHLPELERLKAGLELRALVDSLDWEGPFAPRKAAGAVPLSAGNVPEIHWEESLVPPPPAAAGAALGVPQPEGFDLLSGLGWQQQGAPPPAQQQQRQQQQQGLLDLGMAAPAALAIPDLSSSVRLPAASQATLAKHALLPSLSFGSPPPERPPQPAPLQPRSLYPELAELEPPPPPPQPQVEAALGGLALSSSAAQQQQQPPQPPYPQPSPYGELQLGPQEVGVTSAPRPTQPLPPDATCCAPGPPPPPQQQEQALVPAPPRNGVAEVKRLQQIRDVHVSVALMDEFMRYALGNTRANVESCGILAGVLSPDDAVFTITTLIVPKQKGTSDTVEMLNEEEIFDVQDSQGLYPLGWIHTHPSQTCFLSSVDIHTHCGFQTMLDEAVAIVMAPKDPAKRVGIFRLSTPGGLKLVQRCPQRGFHAHPPTDTGQPIYELCGHVYLNPRAKYEVIDLR
ncbi:hypothetical protein ABPG75_012983 [Micractinium tetrahymenae]